jgi:hypothetical protein
MRTILIGLLLFCGSMAVAQQKRRDTIPAKEPPAQYNKVEIKASFKGSFRIFLEQTLRYPAEAVKKKIEGVVMMHFIVDDKGNISDISVDEFSSQKNELLVNEAKRVLLLSSGMWQPGLQGGKPVKSFHSQSIRFAL